RGEKAAEILDVRLARGVSHDRPTLGEHRCHDPALRSHDRRLVQVHPRAAEPVRAHLVRTVQLHLDAELLEGVDVRVEAPPPDDVPPRRWHGDTAETREERTGEEEGRPDLLRELAVEIRLRDAARIDTNLVAARPL